MFDPPWLLMQSLPSHSEVAGLRVQLTYLRLAVLRDRFARFLLGAGLLLVALQHAGAVEPKMPMNVRIGPLPVDECSQTNPNWLFCSGFEEGVKSIWDNSTPMPDETHLIMENPGPRIVTGNHVMRLRVPPGRGNAGLVKLTPQGYDRLYARWYVMWEPGFDFTASNHGSGLHAGSRWLLGRSGTRPNGEDWFSSWLEPTLSTAPTLQAYTYYPGMYMDCADPNGSCWGDLFPSRSAPARATQPSMRTGQWYCIEMMMDAGTPSPTQTGASGVLNFWVDGLEIGPWNNLWLRTTSTLQLSLLWLDIFFHESHSVEGIMLDNVVMSTSRIGCL